VLPILVARLDCFPKESILESMLNGLYPHAVSYKQKRMMMIYSIAVVSCKMDRAVRVVERTAESQARDGPVSSC
jgi:hypothetical protein